MGRSNDIAARATRRALAAITPETCHSQTQSPLFAVLPGEIRNLIFSYAICQEYDTNRRVHKHASRINHEYRTKISYTLLQTCRLIYYETRYIPIMSATHHVKHSVLSSGSPDVGLTDHYLFHLSHQQAQHIYHLHSTMPVFPKFRAARFLKNDHLRWKKITWTLAPNHFAPFAGNDYTRMHGEDGRIHPVRDTLSSLILPSSCEEAVMEFEYAESGHEGAHGGQNNHMNFFGLFPHVLFDAGTCRHISLQREDGSELVLDEEASCEYTWEDRDRNADDYGKKNVLFATIRLCWRGDGKDALRRESSRYDFINCLDVGKRFVDDDGSTDSENDAESTDGESKDWKHRVLLHSKLRESEFWDSL